MTVEDAIRLQRVVEERSQAQLRLRSAAAPEAIVEAATEYVSAVAAHADLTYSLAQKMGLES